MTVTRVNKSADLTCTRRAIQFSKAVFSDLQVNVSRLLRFMSRNQTIFGGDCASNISGEIYLARFPDALPEGGGGGSHMKTSGCSSSRLGV